MGNIDVGSACIERAGTITGNTVVDRNNPANATGTIDYLCTYTIDTFKLTLPEYYGA